MPLHYNHLIQSFIYSNIDSTLANFLHEKGFADGKRNFKGFTFSRLLSPRRKVYIKEGKIVFNSPIEIVISSPINQFVESLAETILKKEKLDLSGNEINLESIYVYTLPKIEGKIKIRMLSPVTVYSTLSKHNGKKKTYYYSPLEMEFSSLVDRNLKKKYRAYYGKIPSGEFNESLVIKPIKVSKNDEKIILYKGTVIKGWMGVFELEGSPELLRLAYEAGIGSKNSQGFGCFEQVSFSKVKK